MLPTLIIWKSKTMWRLLKLKLSCTPKKGIRSRKNIVLLWKSPPTLPPPTRWRAGHMKFLCIALLKTTALPLIGFVQNSCHRKPYGHVSNASKGFLQRVKTLSTKHTFVVCPLRMESFSISTSLSLGARIKVTLSKQEVG